jgi:hypothetical protein
MQKQNCNCGLIPHGHFKFQCIKIERAQREAKQAARNPVRAVKAVVLEETKTVLEPTRRPSKDEKLLSDQAIREELSKKARDETTKFSSDQAIQEKPSNTTKDSPKTVLKVEPTQASLVKVVCDPKEKTEEELRRERGLAAWAKSCPGSSIQLQKDAFKIALKEKTGHDFSDTTSNGTTAASESDMSLRNSIIIRMGLAEKQEKDLRKKLRTLYEIRVAEQTMSLAKEQGKKTHPNLIEKVGRKASLSADPLVQHFRRAGGSI